MTTMVAGGVVGEGASLSPVQADIFCLLFQLGQFFYAVSTSMDSTRHIACVVEFCFPSC